MTPAGIFGRAGCRGFLHATSLDGVHEVGLDPDALNAGADRLGLASTVVGTNLCDLIDSIARDWLMTRQVTRDRIRLGFGPEVGVAAKSGALMGLVRNELGVVTLPDGEQYAVAAFTRVEEPASDDRAVNAGIGEAAAWAVAEVSSRRRTP